METKKLMSGLFGLPTSGCILSGNGCDHPPPDVTHISDPTPKPRPVTDIIKIENDSSYNVQFTFRWSSQRPGIQVTLSPHYTETFTLHTNTAEHLSPTLLMRPGSAPNLVNYGLSAVSNGTHVYHLRNAANHTVGLFLS